MRERTDDEQDAAAEEFFRLSANRRGCPMTPAEARALALDEITGYISCVVKFGQTKPIEIAMRQKLVDAALDDLVASVREERDEYTRSAVAYAEAWAAKLDANSITPRDDYAQMERDEADDLLCQAGVRFMAARSAIRAKGERT